MIDEGPPPPSEPIHGIFTDVARAERIPPRWVIKDMLPVGLVLVGGPPKSRKSDVLYALSALVAGYESDALPRFLARVERHGRVILFSSEAEAGEIRHKLEVDLGVTLKPDEGLLCADDPWLWRLDDPDGQERLMKWLDDLGPRLVALDPLRDFHESEEKDSAEMQRLLRPLRAWAWKNEACVLLVHHTSKPGDGQKIYDPLSLRGSSAFFGKADGIIMLTPRGQDNERTLIKATFKRGAAWEREIIIGGYGRKGCEVLSDQDREVLGLIKAGAPSLDSIAKQMHVGREWVLETVKRLHQNDLVGKSKAGKWFAKKEGKR